MFRKNLILALVVIITVSLSILFNISMRRPKAEDVRKELTSLKLVMSGADSFSEKKGSPLHYEAYKIDEVTQHKELIGVCFVTTDIVPDEKGYAGPIKMLVGVDTKGNITGAEVLSHQETPSYVRPLTNPQFLGQFKNKGLKDLFIVGKDIDGITRATITSEAVVRSLKYSLERVASEVLKLQVEKREQAHLSEQFRNPHFYILLLFFIAAFFLFYFKKAIIYRYIVLSLTLVYFGFLRANFISMANLGSIFLINMPTFIYNLSWHILIIGGIALTLLASGFYCGWLCPFGALQEILKKLTRFNLKISERIDKFGRILRRLILWFLVILIFLANNQNVANYEPFATIFTQTGTNFAWLLLILVLGFSLINSRLFCKYLCAAGAFLWGLSRYSLFRLKINEACINCKECIQVCPTIAIIPDGEKKVKVISSRCISCNNCVRVCPVNAFYF